MVLSKEVLQTVKGRIISLRKHKTITFVEIRDQFLNQNIQIKVNPIQFRLTGGSCASIEGIIDTSDENNLIELRNFCKSEVYFHLPLTASRL